jgi:hypothetical protein
MKIVKNIVSLAAMLVAGSAFAQGADKKPAAAAPPPAAKPPEKAAEKPPEMAMPTKPPAEMDQLKFMLGTWKCEGKMNMGGPDMPIKSTYKVAWDLDNMWLVGHVEGAKSKDMPRAFKATDFYNYDAGSKNYVQLSIDNMGGWGHSAAKGWEGDKQTWTGKANSMGHDVETKTIITKKSDKEVTLDMTESAPGHNGTTTLTCKK